jgi:hypothetical protein
VATRCGALTTRSRRTATPPLNSSVRPMGPLFSIALIAVTGLLVLGVAFVVARIFHASLVAFAVAATFVLGCGASSAVFLVLSWFIIGAATLTSHWQVLGYLIALAASAVAGGLCLALLFLSVLRRSNISSKRTRVPRAA